MDQNNHHHQLLIPAVADQLPTAVGCHSTIPAAGADPAQPPPQPLELEPVGPPPSLPPAPSIDTSATNGPTTNNTRSGPASGTAEVAYNDLFPALPDSGLESRGPSLNQTNRWAMKMRVGSSTITQVFRVPFEERKMDAARFGEDTSVRACADIMQRTATSIECSTGRDQALTFVVTGKQDAVMRAKRFILENFQTLGSQSISICKEHHRFVLGRGGQRLRDLEQSTATKIQVPREADSSDLVVVTGAREDIEKAVHQLRIISDEQSKQARAVLMVPKKFHPFVCGAHNENVTRMQAEHPGVRINIPPPSVMQDDISIAGEKEGVLLVEKEILKLHQELERKCSSVSVEVNKSQHKYVIGPRGSGLADILQTAGVVVEMPPLDSCSGTITLRGPQDKLGVALTMVYDRANSAVVIEIDCPVWCHRHIIGKKGADIKQLTADIPKVHVEFNAEYNKVKMEGPSEDVEKARERLEAAVRQLVDTMAVQEIDIPVRFHKHIIGKSGANINRIKNDYSVYVSIPENESSSLIRVEGPKEGVVQACEDLLEMSSKMSNEKEREIVIESRFHRQIIGAKGENINQIRQMFDQVIILMPKQGEKSDIVRIRGPKENVDQCYKHLQKVVKDLQTTCYQERVSIYKQHHKFIIGRGGANIRRIRDETGTRIELPDEETDSCEVLITGRQQDVETARDRIQQLQNELDNIVQQDIIIPGRFHNSIIGAGGRHIQAIMTECGGVQIKFPPSDSKSDKVTLRGPKDDVLKAKHILVDLSNEKVLQGHTVEVQAKPEHHRFLIGKKGAKIDALRAETGTRIVFPGEGDRDHADIITIIGKKENVESAKKQLMSWVKDLDLTVSDEVRVPPEHHRHFVARRAEVLRQLKTQYGGVEVSFPRAGLDSDLVTLKGAKECVVAAKLRIQEIVDSLERQVTLAVEIPQRYHGTVMGSRGLHVQQVTRDHDVQIKFPERRAQVAFNPDEPALTNGDEEHDTTSDIIRVTGLQENCEAARDALMALVPHTLEVQVPFDYHRFIIGQRGKGVRDMMNRYDVNISFPRAEDQSETIRVVGTKANAEEAREGLLERMRELDAEREDRQLRSFSVSLVVPAEFHPKIIGRAGSVISRIRQDHDVNVQFPQRDAEDQETITITGYESSAEAARTAIQQLVDQLEQMVKQSVHIDPRVHARIIGGRGKNIRQIMKDFQVEVRFPRSEDAEPDLVVVSGPTADAVDNCIDHLQCLEEEFMQDVTEREELDAHVRPSRAGGGLYNGNGDADGHGSKMRQGFVVSGAPWQQRGAGESAVSAPNVSSAEDFPSFGGDAGGIGGAAATGIGGAADMGGSGSGVVWGPRR